MSDLGGDVLADLAEIVRRSTWLVCFRDTVPPKTMFRGEDQVRDRRVIIANPEDREQVLGGLRILNVPHEIEGEPDGTA